MNTCGRSLVNILNKRLPRIDMLSRASTIATLSRPVDQLPVIKRHEIRTSLWINPRRKYTKPSEVDNLLKPEERITCSEYKKIVDSGEKHLLIDVRPGEDSSRYKLDTAVSLPLKSLLNDNGLQSFLNLIEKSGQDHGKVYVMCRKGISSQIAVKFLKEKLPTKNLEIKDIVGGITAWSKEIDPSIKID